MSATDLPGEITLRQQPTLLCQCAHGHRWGGWAYVVNVCPECSGAAVNEYATTPPPPSVPALLDELANWLRDDEHDGFALTCDQAISLIRTQADELEYLRRWKAEATTVIDGWEQVFGLVPAPVRAQHLGEIKPDVAFRYLSAELRR